MELGIEGKACDDSVVIAIYLVFFVKRRNVVMKREGVF
jgi:hypothetical protein